MDEACPVRLRGRPHDWDLPSETCKFCGLKRSKSQETIVKQWDDYMNETYPPRGPSDVSPTYDFPDNPYDVFP